MAELPTGPLPTDLEQSMLQIMHDVGLSSLTKNILRKRLEAKYKIEFASHAAEVDKTVSKLMMTPEIQRELAKIQQEKDSVSARRAGAKRSASSDKKSRKEEKKENKREVKAKKPEDYPKAALSAYFIFVNDNRDKVREKNPEMKLTEILSEVGSMWKALSESEKARYQKLADEDKKRFDADMAAYTAKGGKVFKRSVKSSKKAKKEKDPNAPKRAMSAYFFFAGDYRAKHTGIPAKQQMTEAGVAWGKMSEEEKKPYEELAAKDRKRYEAERAGHGGAKSSAKADASESESSSDSGSDSE
ncbi:putative high mobility group protein-like tdp-1 [Leptomonas pyrrhocoris]|uniref:Putative high mobility group protein-like tdp-1 n=1 Tax=Leptomonas pyrrhocoris TaxID=157538 RepID=A0A0M9G1G6_LEPPY|nr:putative high mobility group protein-like tdp-1 [Leptomonas pyrrhocoris]KPA80415.1 putative high mobility group protein-like tdp-1 [Leptomonas pyrrhocoris]|eukprot:XP_015658854.1 putative high mobility group protein-like tdp-1 [Leptomonas pyrrhocoris]